MHSTSISFTCSLNNAFTFHSIQYIGSSQILPCNQAPFPGAATIIPAQFKESVGPNPV